MPIYKVNIPSPYQGMIAMDLELDRSEEGDTTILNFLGLNESYEPEVTDLILRSVRPGDTVIDVGANIGYFSVLLSKLTGDQGRLVAVEPGINVLPRLKKNIERNGLSNVTLIENPLASVSDNISFYLNDSCSGGNSIYDPQLVYHNNPGKRIDLRSSTLDEVIDGLGLSPRLIKVDVEGAEHLVLQGAKKILDKHGVPYVIAELHEAGLQQLGSSQAAFRGFMLDHGYESFLLYFDGSLPKLLPSKVTLYPKTLPNLLFASIEDMTKLWQHEIHNPLDFIRK